MTSSTRAIMARERAQDLIEKIVKMSKADGITVTIDSGYQADVRFAANQMSTAGGVTRSQIAIDSAFGKRHAAATTNDVSDDSLRRTVAQSEALAKLSPEDPETMPPLGPQTYVPVSGFFDATADITPEERARAALTALEPSRKAGDLKTAGFIIVNAGANAIGNKNGMFAYNRATTANYTLTVRTNDGTGSGWGGAESPDWNKLDFASLSTRAIEKARLSRSPVAIEPGKYTVILEPQAVGDLVQLMEFYLGARESDEGRSPFTKQGGGNKVGEKIADVPGFAFSDALKAHASETWDYEKLNQWLISPKAFAPGTKMTYAGDKDDADRANIIAYLSTLSEKPVPFPPPAAPAASSQEAAPAASSSEAAPASSSAAPAASSSEAAPAASSAPASSAPASSSAQ